MPPSSPPLSEHGRDLSDRCGARWHRSDPRALSLGSRGSHRGFTRASAVAVSPVRKLMLAGDQVWWKLSPAPPPRSVPPIALGEERVREAAAWLRRGFPAAQRTKKGSDPVRAGVRRPPRARQSREICASTSMARTSGLGSWEPSVVGRERCRNPFTSSRLCLGCSFGFYLGCSSSV